MIALHLIDEIQLNIIRLSTIKPEISIGWSIQNVKIERFS